MTARYLVLGQELYEYKRYTSPSLFPEVIDLRIREIRVI